jgi:hypothetical protein
MFDDQLAAGRPASGASTNSYSIHFVIKAADYYPNVSIAYLVLLTIPVIIASAARNFSKFKLFRNYLRSTISHERLNGLLCAPLRRNVNTKNWYKKDTDLWAEFGKKAPFGRKFSLKHSVKMPAVGSAPSFGRRAVLRLEEETFGNT